MYRGIALALAGVLAAPLIWSSYLVLRAGFNSLPYEKRVVFAGFAGLVVFLVQLGFRDRSSTFSSAELEAFRRDNEAERLKVNPELASKAVRLDRVLALQLRELNDDIRKRRSRASWAYIAGILLCGGALFGPVVAYHLASEHPQQWQYMLGGGLALVLLGSGTVLLRHDNRLQTALRPAERELHYFMRVKAGLECAFDLGEDAYNSALGVVTAHLLAAPPDLVQKTDAAAEQQPDNKVPDDGTVVADLTSAILKALEHLRK